MTTSTTVTILWLLAFVLFVVDAVVLPVPARPRLQSLGLACATLAVILRGAA